MKNLGYEISEDGVTQWRNNGGCVERRSLYSVNKKWENVALPHNFDLKKYCDDGGYKFSKTNPENKKK